MDGKNKAAVLAIGTELVNGQITNRNASWISAELLKHGIQALFHRTIGDDRPLINFELTNLESKVDLLFVTGGLGPTTDDFTRDCIASWANREPKWDEKSWEHIRHRLEKRGVPVREFQRQQCYFPEGSQIIWNTQGTAHGFSLNLTTKGFGNKGLQVFVLPGPPREVEAVWKNGIDTWLSENFRHLDRWIVKSWDCFGHGESEIAHKAEIALEGCPFEKGYRVHLPYVEFKLSYPQSRAAEAGVWIEKTEEALGPWIAARDGLDPASQWAKALKKFDQVWVFDHVSKGYLMQRVAPFVTQEKVTSNLHFIHQTEFPIAAISSNSLILKLEETPHHWAQITCQHGPQTLNRRRTSVSAPYASAALRERELQYFAESALLFWNSALQDWQRNS